MTCARPLSLPAPSTALIAWPALKRCRLEASAIHGNKTQSARRKALEGFKQGKEWVLVATDVAARGIDIAGLPT